MTRIVCETETARRPHRLCLFLVYPVGHGRRFGLTQGSQCNLRPGWSGAHHAPAPLSVVTAWHKQVASLGLPQFAMADRRRIRGADPVRGRPVKLGCASSHPYEWEGERCGHVLHTTDPYSPTITDATQDRGEVKGAFRLLRWQDSFGSRRRGVKRLITPRTPAARRQLPRSAQRCTLHTFYADGRKLESSRRRWAVQVCRGSEYKLCARSSITTAESHARHRCAHSRNHRRTC